LKIVPRLLLCLPMVFVTPEPLACSCARVNYGDQFEKAKSVFVAIPMRAEVITSPISRQSSIEATLEVIDVLKGETPQSIPKMLGAVSPQGRACQGWIGLGEAYVVFLGDKDQSTVFASTCGPNRRFSSLRLSQEMACFKAHYLSEIDHTSDDLRHDEKCNYEFLYSLRGAHNANETYRFDDKWLKDVKRRAESSIQRRVQRMQAREAPSEPIFILEDSPNQSQ